jgi:NADPH-dependent 2,4-dienoyl-CoA reductase/sulfur reductase-like enzyme
MECSLLRAFSSRVCLRKTFAWAPGTTTTLYTCHTSGSNRQLHVSISAPSKRQTLVILGTGWGSYSVLRNLKKRKRLSNLYNIVVISPRNHFLFTPLLASTTVGTLEFRSIIEPVRNIGFRDEQDFHLAHAVGLDVGRKVVKCASVMDQNLKYEVSYDKLVIGVGAVSNDFNVPGVKEHALFLKVWWYGVEELKESCPCYEVDSTRGVALESKCIKPMGSWTPR